MPHSTGENPLDPNFNWPEPSNWEERIHGFLLGLTRRNMHALDWQDINLKFFEARDWPRLDRDIHVSRLWPRAQRHGGVLAVSHEVVASTADRYPGARPALARVNSVGKVVVGMFPLGVEFGTYKSESTEMRTVIRRKGPFLEPVAPAYVVPYTGRVIILGDEAEVLNNHVDLRSLPEELRDTPIV